MKNSSNKIKCLFNRSVITYVVGTLLLLNGLLMLTCVPFSILYDLENNTVHGGCTRYYFCHKGHFKRTKRCTNFMTKEKKLGLNKAVTYKKFREKILNHSNKIYKLVYDLSNKSKKIR